MSIKLERANQLVKRPLSEGTKRIAGGVYGAMQIVGGVGLIASGIPGRCIWNIAHQKNK